MALSTGKKIGLSVGILAFLGGVFYFFKKKAAMSSTIPSSTLADVPPPTGNNVGNNVIDTKIASTGISKAKSEGSFLNAPSAALKEFFRNEVASNTNAGGTTQNPNPRVGSGYPVPWDKGIPAMLDASQKVITFLQVLGNSGNAASLQKQLNDISKSGNPDAISDLLFRTISELGMQYNNHHPDDAHRYAFLTAVNNGMQSPTAIQDLIKHGQSDLIYTNVATMLTTVTS